MITDLPRVDLSGPGGDHRYPQTPLVEGALLTAKLDRCARVDVGSVKTTGFFFTTEVILAAVVATEDDEGLLIEFEFLQQFDDLADLATDPSETKDLSKENPEMLAKLQQFAKDAHQPAVPGTFSDRTLHERDRQAKKGFADKKSTGEEKSAH